MKLVRTRYGELYAFEDDLITDFLELYGEWAQLEINFFSDTLVKSDSRVFDIGAYIGTFSMGVTQHYPTVRILSVEMASETYELLKRNAQHLRKSIETLRAAVVERTASLSYSSVEGNKGATQVGSPISDNEPAKNELVVDGLTLSSLASNYFNPDIIKMDIEGAELAALRGSTSWIIKHHPSFWIECNESSKSIEIYNWLAWAGYEVFYFAFPSFNEDNYKKSTKVKYQLAFEAALIATSDKRWMCNAQPKVPRGCLLYKITNSEDLRGALYKTPRWGKEKWLNLSQIELLGILAHMSQGVEWEEFLC